MKFLIDAQLPRRMVSWLESAGHDAVHTLDLPDSNRTSDDMVTAIADGSDRVVVSKDDDFVDSHLLHACPAKLLLISAGNVDNQRLRALLVPVLPVIVRELQSNDFVEVGWSGVIVRG